MRGGLFVFPSGTGWNPEELSSLTYKIPEGYDKASGTGGGLNPERMNKS